MTRSRGERGPFLIKTEDKAGKMLRGLSQGVREAGGQAGRAGPHPGTEAMPPSHASGSGHSMEGQAWALARGCSVLGVWGHAGCPRQSVSGYAGIEPHVCWCEKAEQAGGRCRGPEGACVAGTEN